MGTRQVFSIVSDADLSMRAPALLNRASCRRFPQRFPSARRRRVVGR